jgi:cell wall assembly regulator SMI1
MNRRGPEVADVDIRRFERELGHELPADYRAFLLDVNGGRTDRAHRRFSLRRGHTILNSLFSLDDSDESRDLAAAQRNRRAEDGLPREAMEIGYDDVGARILLIVDGPHLGEVWYLDLADPRPTGSNPRVEWFDRRDVCKLAGSFAEFMAGLKPLDAGARAAP